MSIRDQGFRKILQSPDNVNQSIKTMENGFSFRTLETAAVIILYVENVLEAKIWNHKLWWIIKYEIKEMQDMKSKWMWE